MKKLVHSHGQRHKGWYVDAKHYEQRFLDGEVEQSVEITIRPGRAALAQMPPGTSFRSGGFRNIAEALEAIDQQTSGR